MAFTTTNTKRRPDRKEQHRQTVAQARSRGRDLFAAVETENVLFYSANGLPKVADPARKLACSKSLALFATTYLPRVFTIAMSDGQRADFATMQKAIVQGGRYAFASPRGDGKTSRVEAAIVWAAMYGHRRCIVIVGADQAAALEIVESVKLEIRTNERLRADFPVPCWAATLSEDTALKAKGWTWGGQSLCMRWGRGGIVLPVLDGADGSGCVIVPRGLTGRLRGMRMKVGEKAVRPDLYAIDDPQTDESATSAAQVDTRERLILGAIMGSGGPKATIAAMMPCTVIKHDDLAARFLDRKRHPDWQGTARGLVKTWPTEQKTLWKEYQMRRKTESQEEADKFYADHREEMDAGAVMDWPERFTTGKETTALQHAENLVCDLGEEVFAAEYQNEPLQTRTSQYELTPELILTRKSGWPRLTSAADTEVICCGVDINYVGLNWQLVTATREGVGRIVAHGKFPQNGNLVEKNENEALARQTIHRAIIALATQINQTVILCNGKPRHADIMAVDCGNWSETVFAACASIRLPMRLLPIRGRDAKSYRIQKGAIKAGTGWHVATWERLGRVIVIDADFWREATQRAFLSEPGAPGSISLYDVDGPDHAELSRQLCAEILAEHVQTAIGHYYRWNRTPGVPNDKLDALTYAHALTAFMGAGSAGEMKQPTRPRYVERRQCRVARGSDYDPTQFSKRNKFYQ